MNKRQNIPGLVNGLWAMFLTALLALASNVSADDLILEGYFDTSVPVTGDPEVDYELNVYIWQPCYNFWTTGDDLQVDDNNVPVSAANNQPFTIQFTVTVNIFQWVNGARGPQLGTAQTTVSLAPNTAQGVNVDWGVIAISYGGWNGSPTDCGEGAFDIAVYFTWWSASPYYLKQYSTHQVA